MSYLNGIKDEDNVLLCEGDTVSVKLFFSDTGVPRRVAREGRICCEVGCWGIAFDEPIPLDDLDDAAWEITGSSSIWNGIGNDNFLPLIEIAWNLAPESIADGSPMLPGVKRVSGDSAKLLVSERPIGKETRTAWT